MAFLARFLHSPTAAVGLMIVSLAVACALLGTAAAPMDPDQQDLMSRLLPPGAEGMEGIHWLGSDALGRDILSRLIVGARVSLLVGVAAMLIAAAIGVTLGLVAGYEERVLGRLLMAITDVQLAIPFLVLALAVVAVLGPSLLNLILVLGVTNWVQYARVVRAECLVLRNLDFVQGAVAAGTTPFGIVTRHLLPNVMSSVTVLSGLLVAKMILFESSLSFLGLGVPPAIPTWGAMIADGRNYVANAWWVAAMPGFALFLTVVGINLVGDRLRDMLDPRLAQLEN
jgi:peptide/nickel transport system permease protein